TQFQEGFVDVIHAAAVLVVTRVPGAQTRAIDEGIGARLVDGGRGRGGDTGRVRVGTLGVILFAILVTRRDLERAGPQFDRRTGDHQAEGFLTLGHDRRRSKGGAARAVLTVEVGDRAGADVLAAEGIERHATIG